MTEQNRDEQLRQLLNKIKLNQATILQQQATMQQQLSTILQHLEGADDSAVAGNNNHPSLMGQPDALVNAHDASLTGRHGVLSNANGNAVTSAASFAQLNQLVSQGLELSRQQSEANRHQSEANRYQAQLINDEANDRFNDLLSDMVNFLNLQQSEEDDDSQ